MSEEAITVECMECEKDMFLTETEQDEECERQYFFIYGVI